MGWLSGWAYRKSHVITGSSGAGTNYQIKVKLCYNDLKIDIIEFVEDITGTDLDAEQGICTDGNNLFITSINRLLKYGMSGGAKLGDVDVFNGDSDVDHTGDCCYYDSKIYITCTNYPSSTVRRVYVYNISDLSFVAKYDITDNPSSGIEISGISHDGSNFWIVTYENSQTRIYKYNNSFVYQNETHTFGDIKQAQGITFNSNASKIYINGVIDGTSNLRLFEYSTSSWSELRKQSTLYVQGLDIKSGYMYIAKSHSTGNQPCGKFYFPPLNQVSLEGHCKSDFGDIRFTSDDCSTELAYWMESKTDDDNAVFWIKISSNLGSNQTIYVYYGRSSATYTDTYTDEEHGENTFLFFDNFEDDSLNTDKWDIENTVVEVDGQLKIGDGGAYYNKAYTDSDFDFPLKLRFYAKVGNGTSQETSGYDYLGVKESSLLDHMAVFVQSYIDPDTALLVRVNDGSNHDTDTGEDFGDWITHMILVETTEEKFYVNDTLMKTETYTINSPQKVLFRKYRHNTGGARYMWIEWVFVAKYISPEPTHSTWSSEEVYSYYSLLLVERKRKLKLILK